MAIGPVGESAGGYCFPCTVRVSVPAARACPEVKALDRQRAAVASWFTSTEKRPGAEPVPGVAEKAVLLEVTLAANTPFEPRSAAAVSSALTLLMRSASAEIWTLMFDCCC